jgi:hypothetical protein
MRRKVHHTKDSVIVMASMSITTSLAREAWEDLAVGNEEEEP